ncbi:hypothetical protein D3C87_369610 [compost metagenome]
MKFIVTLIMLTAQISLFAQNKKSIVLKHEFIFSKAPFAQCHASSIEATKKGLVAAWFGGTKERNPDVEIYVSRNTKGKWTYPISVANGIQQSGERYPCWNPVLYQIPGGNLILFYKVGPSPQTWWGEMKVSADDGVTWGDAKRLPENILGPIKNKPVLLNNGDLLCPASTEITKNSGWKMHFEITRDFGKTWEISANIDSGSKYNAIQQSVLKHGGNKLQILARSKDDGIVSSWSNDNGKTWSKIEKTGLKNPNSGTDAVTLKDGRHLLIYNNSDKPEGKWSGKRTPLNLAISSDGINWKDIAVLESDPGEYSYPAIIQDKEGKVHITYTWRRENIKYALIDISKIKK